MCRKAGVVCSVFSQVFICLVQCSFAQQPTFELQFVESLVSPDLGGINRMAITKDGKFLYAAAWTANRLSAYSRGEHGKLALVKHVEIPKLLEGVLKLKLNQDDSRLLAICLRSNTLLLFKRDTQSGALVPDGFSRDGFGWATCCEFSPDSRFVYVGDSGAAGILPTAASTFTTLRITESGGLKSIQSLNDDCLAGIREIVFDSSGTSGYIAGLKSDSLVVLRRNTNDGTVQIQQVLKDNENGVNGLDGICSVTVNKEGTRVFTVAGRFDGENAVSVFKRADDGTLTLLDQLLDILQFEGGNHIVVTDDQSTIFASGSVSNSVAVIMHDKASGKLLVQRIIESTPEQNISGPSGLVLSPDQQYLYVAAEMANAITSFKLIKK